jgi:16S rRNA (uracil1498-N3)-methyltransferase
MIRVRVEPPLAAGDLALPASGDAYHYLTRVLRLAPGARVVLFDGAGLEADAAIGAIDAERAVVCAAAPRPVAAPVPRIVVLQALIKGDRMDWCVEKLVEVGADEIAIVAAERSVVKLDGDRAAARQKRLQAVAAAAARQCGRADVPAVAAPEPLAAALRRVATCEIRLVGDPAASAPPRAGDAASVALLVGPEGGLAPAELDQAAAAGFAPVTLGPYVLRAETAGPVAVAALRLSRPADH